MSELEEKSIGELLDTLWHHQGASSKVGQAIRKLLGIGPHTRLNSDQIDVAYRWSARAPQQPQPALRYLIEDCHGPRMFISDKPTTIQGYRSTPLQDMPIAQPAEVPSEPVDARATFENTFKPGTGEWHQMMFERLPDGRYTSVTTQKAWENFIAAPSPAVASGETVQMCQEDANRYCQILHLLGLDEAGDPIKEIELLLQIAHPVRTAVVIDAAAPEEEKDGECLHCCGVASNKPTERRCSACNSFIITQPDNDKVKP